MSSVQEWAKHEEELKQTSRLQVNLNSWEDGDILHYYQDMIVMFQELQSDDIVLSNKNRRIIENAHLSFQKIFNTEKK
jgi:SRSO17 transposase